MIILSKEISTRMEGGGEEGRKEEKTKNNKSRWKWIREVGRNERLQRKTGWCEEGWR